MNLLRQIFIVSVMNFRSMPQRFWMCMVIVVGLGATVGVLLSMMSMTEGLAEAYIHAGDPGRAIVVSTGVDSETQSSISRDMAAVIKDEPGIAKDSHGQPLADTAINMGIPVLRVNNTPGYATLRGLGAQGVAVRPEFKLVAGRMYVPGRHEMIVGVGAQDQYQHTAIGDKVIMPDGEWPIVGSYHTGDILDGELLTDSDTLMPAIRKSNYSSVIVRLASYDSLAALKKALAANPARSVTAQRHSDWYNKVAANNTGLFAVLAYAIGAILAIGALFGCVNTMYVAVAARSPEIATLRALGFSAFPVAVSVILEAMMLAAIGAAIGAAIAWALYNGRQDSFGNAVFILTVSPALLGLGIGWALMVALVGGLLPSIHAARLSIVDALRAT
jgi:putative ABC transport system permease protein